MLVVPPGDENHAAVKRLHADAGRLRRGRLRVVHEKDVAHAADDLEAMRQRPERFHRRQDRFQRRPQPPRRRRRRQHVRQVVPPTEPHAPRQVCPFLRASQPKHQFRSFQKSAVVQRLLDGIEHHPAASVLLPRPHLGVVGIEDRHVLGALKPQDVLLRRDVGRHRPVPVQMVRADACDHGHVRAPPDRRQVFQLETRKFQDDGLVRADLAHLVQEALADVASHARRAKPRQHLPQKRRRRALAARTRHADQRRGAQPDEQIHLARDRHACFDGHRQVRRRFRHRRAHHDEVGLREVGRPVPAQMERDVEALERIEARRERLRLLQVRHRDVGAATREIRGGPNAAPEQPQPHDRHRQPFRAGEDRRRRLRPAPRSTMGDLAGGLHPRIRTVRAAFRAYPNIPPGFPGTTGLRRRPASFSSVGDS